MVTSNARSWRGCGCSLQPRISLSRRIRVLDDQLSLNHVRSHVTTTASIAPQPQSVSTDLPTRKKPSNNLRISNPLQSLKAVGSLPRERHVPSCAIRPANRFRQQTAPQATQNAHVKSQEPRRRSLCQHATQSSRAATLF